MRKQILAALLAALTLFSCLAGCGDTPETNSRTPAPIDETLTGAEARLDALRYALLTEGPSDEALLAETNGGEIAVLLSASDGASRARVVTGTGNTAEAAFEAAAAALSNSLDTAIWLKADLVTSTDLMSRGALERAIGKSAAYGFRRGVALGCDFSCAFLEAELNSSGLIDYEEDVLLEERLLEAAATRGWQADALPEEYLVFDAMGWFVGEDGVVHTLSTESGSNYGRRTVDISDPDMLTGIIDSASHYLISMLDETGKFDYGYYPIDHTLAPYYNTIRHAGTVWNMALQYEITGSEDLREAAARAMEHLIDTYVVWPEGDDIAYLLQYSKREIQLGGNALGCLAICRYAAAFGDHRYDEIAEDLARGILTMWSEEEGFIHSLNYPDMSVKEKFLIIYYDGEAAFALTELYSLTGKQEWLEASRKLLDYFVEHDYAQYGDHWISYAVNEMAKLELREEDILLGLANIDGRRERITKATITWHTGAEMLMAGWELYLQAEESGLCRKAVKQFDEHALAESIQYRMDYMLSGYMWPEYAMYFAKPGEVVGSFFVREDAFRIRIDDIQHNLGAYCLYYDNLESVLEELAK